MYKVHSVEGLQGRITGHLDIDAETCRLEWSVQATQIDEKVIIKGYIGLLS